MEISLELGYLKTTSCESVMEKIDYERCMLRKLISKLSENSILPPPSAIQAAERVPSPGRAPSALQKNECAPSPLQY